jgi:hypothetical protein
VIKDIGEGEKTCDERTNPSIILNGLLWHIVFAEIGEKIIADYSVHSFKTFASSRLLVLGGGGGWDCGERVDDGSGGSSDGSHYCGEETIKGRSNDVLF